MQQPGERQRCGAKTRSGKPCKNPLVRGSRRCRMHRGTQPKGAASPSFKHGRYSKHLPTRLAARYEEALHDPQLLEQKAEIGLLDARLADLLGQVETGAGADLWKEIRSTYGDLRQALVEGDNAGVSMAMVGLDRQLKRIGHDQAAWREIYGLVEQRRKLVESERKHRLQERLVLTVEEAMWHLSALTDAVRKHVSDRDKLAAIYADYDRLTAGQAARPAIVDGSAG